MTTRTGKGQKAESVRSAKCVVRSAGSSATNVVVAAFASFAVVLGLACSSGPAPPAPATNRPAPTSVATAPEVTPPATEPAWTYDGETGPDRWGALSPRFAACSVGQMQSPIDIVKPQRSQPPALEARFAPIALSIATVLQPPEALNMGFTIQVTAAGADTLAIGDDKYQLVQYHFHNPSEHRIAGKPAAMEMHMVHLTQQGQVAVVGVLFEEGAPNPAYEPVLANLPKEKGSAMTYAAPIDVSALLPKQRRIVRYDGSLTTPPCSEGVHWIVMASPVEMSATQIARFAEVIHTNARPPQPLNGRPVVSDWLRVTN